MLWTVPSNLAAALYRARGLYGRAAKVQNAAVLVGQLGQLVAIVATGSLLAVTLAFVAAQVVAAIWLLTIDAPRAVSVSEHGARDAFMALDCQLVSQAGSICGRGRHRPGVAQSGGLAGQRWCQIAWPSQWGQARSKIASTSMQSGNVTLCRIASILGGQQVGNVIAAAGEVVVRTHHFGALGEQPFTQVGSDEACAADDEDVAVYAVLAKRHRDCRVAGVRVAGSRHAL
jgi:hypothetical protein